MTIILIGLKPEDNSDLALSIYQDSPVRLILKKKVANISFSISEKLYGRILRTRTKQKPITSALCFIQKVRFQIATFHSSESSAIACGISSSSSSSRGRSKSPYALLNTEMSLYFFVPVPAGIM